MAAAVAVGSSCSSDAKHPTSPPPPDQRYWTLSLNQHGVTLATLAPYDTLTLNATPYTFTHTVLATTAPTIYTSSDPTTVTVSATGVLRALQAGQGVTIVARRTIGTLTLADTATVNVNPVPLPPPVLVSLSIHPASGDSADVNAGLTKIVTPFVVDTKGDTLSNVAVYFRSSDSTIAPIDQFGNVTGIHPGHITVFANAIAYGVSRSDSIAFTVKQPVLSYVMVLSRTPTNSTKAQSSFSPGTATVAQNGVMIWMNESGQPVDIVFDDTTGVEPLTGIFQEFADAFYSLDTPNNPNLGGNIPAFAATDSTNGGDGRGVRLRAFPNLGTYPFHSTLYNTAGKIVVTNQ